MAGGLSDHVWDIEEIVGLIERREDIRSGAALVG
jgi:hypothetical protein